MRVTLKPSDIYDEKKVEKCLVGSHKNWKLIGFRAPVEGEYFIDHTQHEIRRSCSEHAFPKLVVEELHRTSFYDVWE